MEEHYRNDPEVTPDDVRKGEKELNNHARVWVRIFNIGGTNGQRRRCARALMSNWVTIPVLEGLRKDHKGNMNNDPDLGPKVRLLCAANRAPNAAFGNLIAKVAKAVGDSISGREKGEVVSTEELKRNIEEANKSLENKPREKTH